MILASDPPLGPRRRPRRHSAAGAIVVALALVVAACSSGGDEAGGGDTAGPGSSAESSAAPAPSCDQGATIDPVQATPVPGTPSDLDVTSFDGTDIRIHWFPLDGAGVDDPAPTVLMGPGWSSPGATPGGGPALFGGMSISTLRDAGYNVVTWDPRGFGESGGTVQIDAPDPEGRDVAVLLDWVAAQPEAMSDAAGDPRAGMVGASYGGGIQLTVAAIDCRVDALVPSLAWHSLETSLYKSGIATLGWATALAGIGSTRGTLDPHIDSAITSSRATGRISDEDLAWFRDRGPGDLVDDIEAPTLLVQGTVDTLFPLDEAVANFASLQSRDVPSAMLWFCGGHGVCLTDDDDAAWVADATVAWLARYLDDDESVEVAEGVTVADQDGTRWAAGEVPAEGSEPVRASGGGTLELTDGGGSGPVEVPEGEADLLAGVVAGFTPSMAGNAIDVDFDAPAAGLALGAPRLSLTYSGTAPDGERPTRIFAQLVDAESGLVVGNQVTPVAVTLDGERHETEVDLEVIAHRLEAGEGLTLQLVATTTAYALPRLGGSIEVERAELTVPLAEDLERAG